MLDDAARWYLASLFVGVLGLLPVAHAFGRLHSRGVLYARAFGMVLLALSAWILGLSPVGYGMQAILGAVVVALGWSGLVAWRAPEVLRALRDRWRLALVGEAVFLVTFVAIAFARSFAPDAVNTEKPMDMMILVAVRTTESMPPEDSWFAGRPLSYYHLGHTAVDILSRLARVEPGVAFNLGLASAGAMAAAAAFALAGDAHALTSRARPRTGLAGAVAVIALMLVASLEGALELIAANVGGSFWARLGVSGFPAQGVNDFGVPSDFWWWWRATRVLPDAIAEFPAFSFILGDMHAHVLALPIALLALAIALTAFEGSRPQTFLVWTRRPGELAAIAVIFAALAMTNAWDAPLYGAVWLAAGAWAYCASGWSMPGALMGMVRHLVPPALIAGLIAWPMFSVFDHAPLGVAPVLSAGSDPARFLLIWSPLLVILGACALVTRPGVDRDAMVLGAVYGGSFVLAWAMSVVVIGQGSVLVLRGVGWLTLLGLVAGASVGTGAATSALASGDRGRASWLALAAGVAFLVLLTELFHLSDALPGRFNSVFKFWYGAWVMLAIACGVAAADAAASTTTPSTRSLHILGGLAVRGAALVVACAILYVPAAISGRATEGQRRGLDALAFLSEDGSGRGDVIAWARTLEQGAVLLEATGRPYQDDNKISMASGVPTVLGWDGHEVTWRGDHAGVGERSADVTALYGAGATDVGLSIARRYAVTHVYVGSRERERYGSDVARHFEAWPIVFDSGGGLVFEVPQEAQP